MSHDEIARIEQLAHRLEDLCREGQQIRDTIQEIARRSPVWPDPRAVARYDRMDSQPSEIEPFVRPEEQV
jgi:hypothetical protein